MQRTQRKDERRLLDIVAYMVLLLAYFGFLALVTLDAVSWLGGL